MNMKTLYEHILIEEAKAEAEHISPAVKKSKYEECELFVTKRAGGAAKIQKSAEAKGGYSTLTAIHFAAKARPYADVKKWCDKEGKDEYLKSKATEAYKKLSNLDTLSQREFQHLTGVLEAYGESYLKSTKPNSIKL